MKDLGPGDSDPVIALVCEKLNVYPPADVYTEAFAQKLRGLQRVRGLEVDGILSDSILELLGIPPSENT